MVGLFIQFMKDILVDQVSGKNFLQTQIKIEEIELLDSLIGILLDGDKQLMVEKDSLIWDSLWVMLIIQVWIKVVCL